MQSTHNHLSFSKKAIFLIIYFILVSLGFFVFTNTTLAAEKFFDVSVPPNYLIVPNSQCGDPDQCANSYNPGNCGLSDCAGGLDWTKYYLTCAQDPDTGQIFSFYQQGERVCSIGDKCIAGEQGLRPGYCSCDYGSSRYKVCCSSGTSAICQSLSGTIIDDSTYPDEGQCPSGTTETFCGFDPYPPCDSACSAPTSAPTPTPPPPSTCTPDGSCSAPTPSCGQTTFGTDNCGNSCSKTGPICPSDASTCTSVTFNSSTITAGQNYTATVNMRNDGTTTWTSAANYKLGAQDPQDDPNWGTSTGADSGKGTRPTRVALPSSISPGSTGTFSFGVTAPDTAGDYRFAYQMLIEGVAWFGSRCGPNISVSPPCPSSIPAPTNLSPNGTTFPATTTSVTVSWNPVSGASRYAVRLRDNTINPSTTCGSSNVTCVDSVTGTSYTFNNLVAGHSYTWWVHAIINAAGSCTEVWSSPATANFSIDTSCAFSCGACPTKNTCGSTTYDTCADNLGQSGASLCTNGASGFRCYAFANTSCQSAPPGTYNYACSACNMLTVQCSASPSSAQTGQSVTWTADPSGGSGTYTSYSWTGTDILTGSSQSVSKSYSTVGTKYAGVTVTDSLGQTAQSPGYPNSCSVVISTPPPAGTYNITGIVFVDTNSNATIDTTESCYSGTVTVSISPQVQNSITYIQDSACNNRYTFSGIAADIYTLTIQPISGHSSTNSPAWQQRVTVP